MIGGRASGIGRRKQARYCDDIALRQRDVCHCHDRRRWCGSADLKVSDIAGHASVIGGDVEIIFSSAGARLERDLRQLGCAHDQRLVGALRLRHSIEQEFAAACRPRIVVERIARDRGCADGIGRGKQARCCDDIALRQRDVDAVTTGAGVWQR